MAGPILANGLDLSEPWWTLPEYQEGELYLPGQSRLGPDDMVVLEKVSLSAEKHKLSIPAMPQAAMEASQMLKNPDSDVMDIAKIIARDPVMAAQILRFANSAMYGARFPVDTIERAVSHLGMRHLQTVVLEMAMNRISHDVGAKAYAQQEWRHSITCAMIARRIGEKFKLDADLCYLAGLLHDIGRLPVISALSKRGLAQGDPIEDSPTEIIVESLHRAVGVQVADSWDLPPVVRDAIAHHLTGRLEGEGSSSAFPSTKVAEAAGDICIAIGEGRFRKPFAILEIPSLPEIGIKRDDLRVFLRDDLPDIIAKMKTD
ncbi:MAG: putative nucleotidyltransferase with HDIG domain [Planctomycetota bacterium]|jgi:putative nucleotidyltransferase with HDIG domain